MTAARLLMLAGLALLPILLQGAAHGAVHGSVNLANSYADTPLGRHLQHLAESGQPLTPDAALAAARRGEFQTGQSPTLGFGIDAPPTWLYLRIHNPGGEAALRRLLIENSWLDDLEIFFVHRGELVRQRPLGDRYRFAERTVAQRTFHVDHSFAPGETELLLRAASPDPLVLPVFLLTRDEADQRNRLQSYSYGAVYGFLAALLAYNSVLFLSLGDRRYLLYAGFLGSFLLLNLAYTGHGYAWLWPESPTLQRWIIPWLMVLCAMAGLAFARAFLDTREHTPRTHRLITWGMRLFGSALVLATALAGDQAPALQVAFVFMTLFSALMILLGVAAYRAGTPSSRYFLLASIASMAGTATTALAVWGVIPYTDLGFRAAEFGMLVDATLLALALGARFRFIQLEKALSEVSRSQLAERNQRLSTTLREVERLATTDRLTGLWNRLHVERVAAAEMDRAARYQHPTSLLLFDIDHFKRVNDRFGHRGGDEVLTGLAGVARQCLRESDVIARWGGEEFLVLMPSTALPDAIQAADKLRRQVAASLMLPGGEPVTISIGVAEWCGETETLDAWIARADRVLYLAKENGRNRIEADPSQPATAANEVRPLLQLTWNTSYESGIPQIDCEHRALVEAANRVLALLPRLASPATAAAARAEAIEATDALMLDARSHFDTEEAYLRAWQWPELEAHQAEHVRLLERARQLRDQLHHGEPGAVGTLLIDFLAREVVAGHILVDDRAYFPFAVTDGEPQPVCAPS